MTLLKTRLLHLQVCTTEKCEVPAGCEVLVNSKVKGDVAEREGFLVQDSKFVEQHSMLVARVLVDCGNTFHARILNPNSSAVMIPKGTVIALFEPIQEIAEYDSNEDSTVYRVT
ncbi:hypothetical protein DPMN_135957 [Dreissena polymorpha]|uniref:Uncharacterized protein n=1 Tax=Dreissena polymorpha TaxID=45954 RepID=A0A9D4G2H7_DREPO|nr:hypothetical protein DPMN_135957 [Dreissena polymorpha]